MKRIERLVVSARTISSRLSSSKQLAALHLQGPLRPAWQCRTLGTSQAAWQAAKESKKASVTISLVDLPTKSRRSSRAKQSSASGASGLGADLDEAATDDPITGLGPYAPRLIKSKRKSKKAKDADGNVRNETDPLPEDTDQAYPGMTVEESQLFNAACNAGKVPDTELSRLIYKNWIRFPETVILFRVGSFYEVSNLLPSRPTPSSSILCP